MTSPIEEIRRIIDQHRRHGPGEGGATCACGATRLPDHPRHVAEEIVRRLGLTPEHVGDLQNRLRYVSAVFDDELTKLEGAE